MAGVVAPASGDDRRKRRLDAPTSSGVAVLELKIAVSEDNEQKNGLNERTVRRVLEDGKIYSVGGVWHFGGEDVEIEKQAAASERRGQGLASIAIRFHRSFLQTTRTASKAAHSSKDWLCAERCGVAATVPSYHVHGLCMCIRIHSSERTASQSTIDFSIHPSHTRPPISFHFFIAFAPEWRTVVMHAVQRYTAKLHNRCQSRVPGPFPACCTAF